MHQVCMGWYGLGAGAKARARQPVAAGWSGDGSLARYGARQKGALDRRWKKSFPVGQAGGCGGGRTCG